MSDSEDKLAAITRAITKYVPNVVQNLIPGGGALLLGFTANDPNLVQVGLTQLGISGLVLAAQALEEEGKRVDLDSSGIGEPLKIAMRYGQKGNELRSRWFQLLKNSIDPDFPHEIRDDDIALADTLSPSDFLLIYVMNNHRSELSVKYKEAGRKLRETHPNDVDIQQAIHTVDMGGLDSKLVISQASNILGSRITVPPDEVFYSLMHRGDMAGGNGDLFKVYIAQNEQTNHIILYANQQVKYPNPRSYPGSDAGIQSVADNGGFFVAALNRRSARICKLFDKYSK